MKKILILVPHDDDFSISFGGLAIKEIAKGNWIHVHEFTVGGPCSNVSSDVRFKEFKDLCNFIRVQKATQSGVNMDGRLDTLPNCDITHMIDLMIEEDHPDEVYCASDSEHMDHRALYNAFKASCRLRSGWQPKLFAVGTYMFSNQLYNDSDGGKIFNPLSEEVYNKKQEAFAISKSQFKPAPSPLGYDGVRIMSEYYGMLCGTKYAEMYYQLRYLRSI